VRPKESRAEKTVRKGPARACREPGRRFSSSCLHPLVSETEATDPLSPRQNLVDRGTEQAAEARPAATRLPTPPAPGASSSRPKSAMRSKMPQRRPAGLSALRIGLLKASLSSPKVTSTAASSHAFNPSFTRSRDRLSEAGRLGLFCKSRAAPNQKPTNGFLCERRFRLWPKTSELGAFSGPTRDTTVASAVDACWAGGQR
jgi:hypothetical protein